MRWRSQSGETDYFKMFIFKINKKITLHGVNLTCDEILILGAGPAGLAAGYKLSGNKKRLVLIEKNDQVGGLSRTLQFGDFKTDIGPHRFFSKNKYLYDLASSLLGDRWVKINRFSRMYIKGKYYKYPIDIVDVVTNLGFISSFRISFDFIKETIKKNLNKKEPQSFEEYIISNFGRSLAELNMLSYTEKVWGIPCSEISPIWASQRIKGLSIWSVLKNSLFKSKGPKTLVDQFYYPDRGAGFLYESMKNNIVSNGGILRTSSYPTKIEHNANKITKVTVNEDGKINNHFPSYLISSIPIHTFLKLLSPKPPTYVFEALKKLRFRSQVFVFLTLNTDSVTRDNWLYYPDKNISFGRLHEPKNCSKKLSPVGKTSLFVEYFVWKGDKIWNMNDKDLFDHTVSGLESLKLIKHDDVSNFFVHREEFVYPVYDLEYSIYRPKVIEYLKRFSNLILIGRPGRFRYTNQDHSLEMGILAAQSIIDGKEYNLDDVGAENEYFEKGTVN